MIDNKYEIHFAPLQGLTDAPYRRLHAQYFGGVDFYYTPFIRIERGLFRKRDLRELAEETLENCIPQILPGSGEELKHLIEPIVAKGCKRIDVNIGCPFPPVMAHGRGSALLNNPDNLFDVLNAITELKDSLSFSLKMRLGYDNPAQWKDTIDAVNATPLHHVAMHARIAKQQYKGECDMEAFDEFAQHCKHPLIYNGDIKTVAEAEQILARWPQLKGIMIGRGLIADPLLAKKLRGDNSVDLMDAFRAFHSELYNDAAGHMTDARQVAEHMKPYWEYMFQDADRKVLKMIKKAHNGDQYLAAVSGFLNGNL